jgi:hypothetical protein
MQLLDVSGAVRNTCMSLGVKGLNSAARSGRHTPAERAYVGRFHPFIGHEGPSGEYRYSSTLFLTSALEGGWGVSVTPRPQLTPGKDPIHIVQEAGWASGPVWTGAENLGPTGIRSPDRPACRQSLYRLRYPAHKEPMYLLNMRQGWPQSRSGRREEESNRWLLPAAKFGFLNIPRRTLNTIPCDLQDSIRVINTVPSTQ